MESTVVRCAYFRDGADFIFAYRHGDRLVLRAMAPADLDLASARIIANHWADALELDLGERVSLSYVGKRPDWLDDAATD